MNPWILAAVAGAAAALQPASIGQRAEKRPASGIKPRRVEALGIDCGTHAQARIAALGLPYPTGAEVVTWAQARRGDLVRYAQCHIGVVFDPKRRLVESRWGINGPAYVHPADATPYGPVLRIDATPREKFKD